MKTLNLKTIFLTLPLVVIPVLLFSHGDNKHIQKSQVINKKDISKNEKLLKIYEVINSKYVKDIKPIFEKKCFDCHGGKTNFPWYYKIPGIKYMIDSEIKEAKKHIDMREDFPFISHEAPVKDLESLYAVSMENAMPPLLYVLEHWEARLDESEQQKIKTWTKESIKQIKKVRYK
ncbi:MAG: hypothetical protein GQ474_07750 [Sulfurimonas sp.]|nr:hypothetical protein [Sulfurimonas sp.]